MPGTHTEGLFREAVSKEVTFELRPEVEKPARGREGEDLIS